MKYITSFSAFFIFIIILQNTSCVNGNKYAKEEQSLDSLQILVIKADSVVKSLDSVKISDCTAQINKDLQLISMWHIDSMSGGAASIFKDFSGVRWSLLTDIGKKRPLLMELEKSQNQLDHLSHDLRHNLVRADSVKIYIAFETQKAVELVQASYMSVGDVNRQLPLYTAIAPKADSLMTLLKNHKKI
jgi:hypothetical protein